MEASAQISKEDLEDQAICDRVRILVGAPELVMHAMVRGNPKMQWGPQNVEDAKNMKCLSREAHGSEESKPSRVSMWAATRRRTVHLLWGSHHHHMLWVLVQKGFGSTLLFMPLFFHLGMEIFTLYHYILGVCNLLLSL
jgi:hypothetical protein